MMHKIMKHALPGYIQACDKDQMQDIVHKHTNDQ